MSVGHTNIAETFFGEFLKITEHYQRLLKAFKEDIPIIHHLRDKLDISEFIDIFSSEDMEKTPPDSQMWFRMKVTNGVFSSKILVSI